MGVHPSATVAAGAELDAGVTVGPGCYVGPRARLGAHCTLHSHVVIDGDTEIGADTEVFPFAVLGARPQDKKLPPDFDGAILRIGRGNQIREHVTVHGGTPHGSGVTVIGDHNMLLAGCHVGHDAVVGSHVVITNGAMIAGHAEIQDHVILGAMVGVHQFTRVGTRAMIGAGSMLSKDAPPFALVQGDRARLIAVNVVGLKRAGLDVETTQRIKQAFRLLFWRSGLEERRLAAARAFADGDPTILSIVDFVAASRRGVCMPRGRVPASDESALAES